MTLNMLVGRFRRETDDIVSIELVDADGHPLPAFSAGSHIDVHIGNGLVRQYSLCNSPAETNRYVIGVLKDPKSRGGSVALHDMLAEGLRLRIGEPRNLFPLDETADRSLLFAGGIGITPMLAMAERLRMLGRPFELHYWGRSLSRMAFLNHIAASDFKDDVRIHCDDAPEDQRVVPDDVLPDPEPGSHVYVCGPQGFIDRVLERARMRGWPESRLHKEYFGSAVSDPADDGAFTIRIAHTGAIVPVKPGQSVVAALAEHGIELPVSCEQGVCGTCLTRIVDGIPDHRDSYLTDDEREANTLFLPCCSRAKSECLVIDIR
ncbi:Vanillate O-demethylase oxidoreductase [Azospirillum sp. TSH100]|uniref:PDR/VanB family oxidoreductase n=1 Tax=Azospirillum sp. TSH100 TaxID=652764 RepID=UPI000D604D65|nr:PDR/VanB family oxidoreductase [Azospirillum sp. TSH100]PWC80668.1 Vanillate O-demethylase oxidoreductase [Azospirillum sp. TSH100]QCG90106.1 oxidoreductase [Azospirillum sp. TSH100]